MRITGWRRAWHWLKRLLCASLLSGVVLWLLALLAFRFLPVPCSALMAERQISAWLRGDRHYHLQAQWVDWQQISPSVALAVIASEDQKFPEHWGFDGQAILQALRHNGQRSPSRGLRGASTLSQQTVKNLFLWPGRSWLRKGLEAVMTLGLEATWSKQRILTVYLNIAEFGEGIFGVQAAARHYFGKPASRLTPREAALLAAVLPNPRQNTIRHPNRHLRLRQQWILQQMQQLGGENFLRHNHL